MAAPAPAQVTRKSWSGPKLECPACVKARKPRGDAGRAIGLLPVRLAALLVVVLAAVAAKQPQLDSSYRGRDLFYDALAHFHSTLFELAQGTASAVKSSCGACFEPLVGTTAANASAEREAEIAWFVAAPARVRVLDLAGASPDAGGARAALWIAIEVLFDANAAGGGSRRLCGAHVRAWVSSARWRAPLFVVNRCDAAAPALLLGGAVP